MYFIFNLSTYFRTAFLYGLQFSAFAYSSFNSVLVREPFSRRKIPMLNCPFLSLFPWCKIPADEPDNTKLYMTVADDIENIAVVSLFRNMPDKAENIPQKTKIKDV